VGFEGWFAPFRQLEVQKEEAAAAAQLQQLQQQQHEEQVRLQQQRELQQQGCFKTTSLHTISRLCLQTLSSD